MQLIRAALVLGLAVGCFGDDKGDNDSGAGGDGTSADGGTGGGGDGTGGGGDGTGGGSIDCDRTPSTADPDDSCVTAELSCGDSVVFDMAGAGGSRLDGGVYSSGGWACWPVDLGTYGGGERFFRFDHPGNSSAPAVATIRLDSPCADLDLFAFWWESDTCPSGGASPYECETTLDSNPFTIWNNEPRSYLLAVEGAAGAEGPFRITIDCEQ